MNRVVHPVEAASFRWPRARRDTAHVPPPARAVVGRVVHSAARPDRWSALVTDETEPVAARAGTSVVDVEPDAAGIVRRETARRPGAAESRPGLPRPAHTVRGAYEEAGPRALPCAPTAPEAPPALDASAALGIGPPVGCAGAAASRAASRGSGLPAVRAVSDRGGPAVAAAAVDAPLNHPASPSKQSNTSEETS
ncbi:precorrin-8X methylmutase [Streptomyces sp. NPDC006527]|uniref:precorrin-8X methylmutase n=1 Tax=Streptomyces sp. NPDC006527 TaxID=3364749 RepID=UPI003685E1EF